MQTHRHTWRLEDGVLPPSRGDFDKTNSDLRMEAARDARREAGRQRALLAYVTRLAGEQGRVFTGPREAVGFVLEIVKRHNGGVFMDGDFRRCGLVGRKLWRSMDPTPAPEPMLVVMRPDFPEPPRAA